MQSAECRIIFPMVKRFFREAKRLPFILLIVIYTKAKRM